MNPNILVSQIFVDQLASSGLTDVVLCPGSRSTPLTLMFEAEDRIEAHLSLDERSGAFFALGMAQATGRPVAMVCTSGTAAANFCLLYTSPSPRDKRQSRMPSSA